MLYVTLAPGATNIAGPSVLTYGFASTHSMAVVCANCATSSIVWNDEDAQLFATGTCGTAFVCAHAFHAQHGVLVCLYANKHV